MMSTIDRDHIASWLDALTGSFTLLAPADIQGVLLYRPVKESSEILWDFGRPVLSIKDAFFPATEQLLTIEKSLGNIEIKETLPDGAQVIFGVRPCDAKGLKALDAVFLDTEPEDIYFARRRENTTLIGLACKEMGETCFCTSLGGSPDDPQDMDVMISEVEGGYKIQAVTDKGCKLLSDYGLEPSYWDLYDGTEKVRNTDKTKTLDAGSIQWPDRFSDDYWASMSERCLSCRICAYVCPACRCFDLRDEALPSTHARQSFERIRCWDSCTSERYRLIAGGHNSRPTKEQRLRNRVFCKFYYYPQQYGPTACTGCGRCVESCPVNIDMLEVLEHLAGVPGR
jgi:sulfhydrogenase subunit beta (sulfur reductase)